MKKLIVAVALVGLCMSLAQAQAASITLRPMFGYGIGTGKMVVGADFAESETATTKNENMYYSAGGGLKLGLGLDAEIAEHVALGIDVGYSMGLNAEVDKGVGPGYTYKREAKASYLPISLTLKVKSKLEKITVFAGFGPTVLMAPKGVETYNVTFGTSTGLIEEETTFKMGFGYHGLAGIEYGFTDKMSFIAQLRADQVSLKADKGEVTKVTLNGADQLAGLTIHEKNTTYLEDTTGAISNSGVPDIEHTYVVPANSYALNIGISIGF